jgi:hypothetical protein
MSGAHVTDAPAMAADLGRVVGASNVEIRPAALVPAHRKVGLYWMRRRADSAVVKAFLDAQERAPLPPGVLAV